ncbi:MAG: response regulator [Bacteroidota bacterium]|nr:response regulator [Bacteroidota bacterium]
MTSKIKVLVVEDSALIAEDISYKLAKHHFEVMAVCDKGEDAIEFLKKNEPDLVLLDIRLAGALDGISTGYMIKKTYSLPIIYLSDLADADTLNRAKQTRPSNYLTKPFNEADLVRAIDLAFSNFNAGAETTGNTAGKPDHIFIKSENTFVRVPLSAILYLHADRAYCNIVTDDRIYVQSLSMNHVFEQINSPDFVRIHRSHVVNIHKVTAIEGNMVKIGKHSLEMSKGMRDELMGRLTFLKQ